MTNPIDNCFWVIPDVLLAGEHPALPGEDQAKRRIRRFLVAGVNQFIDLSDKARADISMLARSGTAVRPAA